MKKVAALAIMMVIALAASQPAMAGVGGCRTLGTCPGGWSLTASGPQEQTPSVLDALRGALPTDVYTFLKALFIEKGNDGGIVTEAPQTPTTSGVGGCQPRIGVGGCLL